jgi:hypothetical protein
MGFVTYWLKVIRVALSHTLDLTQTVLFLLVLLAGAIGYFNPSAAPWLAATSGWTFTLVVLSGVILVRLVLAPYWIDKDKDASIAALRPQTSPSFDSYSLDPVPLVMASFLMCDEVPDTKTGGHPRAHLMFVSLANAIRNGEVLIFGQKNRVLAKMTYNATFGNMGIAADIPEITGKTLVSRQELCRYGQSHGLQPQFLKRDLEIFSSDGQT